MLVCPHELSGCEGVYSLGVDMWAVGCVFAEMATGLLGCVASDGIPKQTLQSTMLTMAALAGRPLFQGDSEIDTIFKA